MIETFVQAVLEYKEELRHMPGSLLNAQPEDQLKRPVQTLLEKAAHLLNVRVETRSEVRVAGLGRPDLGVTVNRLPTGYIELKAPGKGTNPERFRGADKLQWHKFKSLPNIIYCDGLEWTLYHSGQQEQGPLSISRKLGESQAREEARSLIAIFRDFLLWEPTTPRTPQDLAAKLAPLCRLLRDDVLTAVGREGSAIGKLPQEWRELLFSDATDFQFADAYAQTITYALLLARFEGAETITTGHAATALERGHGLLARTLHILSMQEVKEEIRLGVEILERVIEAIDLAALATHGDDPWLYFYEDFLSEYDPKLRKDRGVYYTPTEVIQAQCHLVSQVLESQFGKSLSFADDGVVVLDPAAGTGPYPRMALAIGLERVRQKYGPGAVPPRATTMAKNLHAFELLVGPYAVAHLRVTQGIIENGGMLPQEGVHVYLTDTLESPCEEPKQGKLGFMYERLAEEHRRAIQVKSETRVLVCIGNPPYNRGNDRSGGWVRFGGKNEEAILEDFAKPAKRAGFSLHLKNLYNDYVYFWRWALWKVFDTTADKGIVSFITASSYLRGPGFVGMRRVMREVFDDLWIIDLEGDSVGPRKTENVFEIKTPVAIAIGVRYSEPSPETPAKVRYTRLQGSRAEKLAKLALLEHFEDLEWAECYDGWLQPFLPRGESDYFSWPEIKQIFPWQHSGVQFKRTWPIGVSPAVLRKRWSRLCSERSTKVRRRLFRETDARKVERLGGEPDEILGSILPYGYRSFDRQWAILSTKVADRIRPDLLQSHSGKQVYLTSLLTGVLGDGPAAVVSAHLPDLHHFQGSYGGKDVIPLWRDREAARPNVCHGLLSVVGGHFGVTVTAEDLFTYVYAVLSAPSYCERFSEELAEPGPRVPITKNANLFRAVSTAGRELVFLHTYGERFSLSGVPSGTVPSGSARCVQAVPGTEASYPQDFSYDERLETLHVGAGQFHPVSADVWAFHVSDLDVVRSWLGSRMHEPSGRASSPLDEIVPDTWTAEMTEELLRLLWVLEATIARQPALDASLTDILGGPIFQSNELPQPSAGERKPIVAKRSDGKGQLTLI